VRSRTRYCAVAILLFGALLLIGPGMRHAEAAAPSATGSNSAYRCGELLIKFKPHVRALESQAVQILARGGAERTGELRALGVERWQIPAGQEIALAEKLNALPDVEYAEPNYLVWAHLTPDDPYYSLQWAHTVINSPAAWDLTTGSSAVTVAVIDTGVDMDHPELLQQITQNGYDFANNDSNPDDDNGHGTHVAGIIAAAGNNGQGIAADTAQGITYAVDNGADIINISLGGVQPSSTLYNAVRYAHTHGVLVVASAGNCGDGSCGQQNPPIYPAAYDTEVFAVAATES